MLNLKKVSILAEKIINLSSLHLIMKVLVIFIDLYIGEFHVNCWATITYSSSFRCESDCGKVKRLTMASMSIGDLSAVVEKSLKVVSFICRAL